MKIPRHPLGTYLRAVRRAQRISNRITTAIYRRDHSVRDHLFRVYFDNDALIVSLSNIMKERGIAYTTTWRS